MEEVKTLFIPCAGIGSRVANYSNDRNKALITIGDKPAISHIIDQFDNDWEIVVALGYDGDNVRDYLQIAHPNKNIKFVNVSVWDGPESGLARTLWESKEFLQKPFVFWANDTICPKPRVYSCDSLLVCGWSGPNNYRKVSSNVSLSEKNETGYNYVGVAVVKNYQLFWELLHPSDPNGECGAVNKMMMRKHFYIEQLFDSDWMDIGNKKSLEATLSKYKSKYNILPKQGEATWFVNDLVIKYHKDPKFIENRVKRANLLRGHVPQIHSYAKHFYSYKKVDGSLLSNVLNKTKFRMLLKELPDFWRGEITSQDFVGAGLKFYKDKTFSRVNQYLLNNSDYDCINGTDFPSITSMLYKVDWNSLANSCAARWHGDLHFENILWGDFGFVFLDWREDYGGLDTGDHFYDLAKLYHGIIFPHDVFANNKFEFSEQTTNINKYTGNIANYKYSIPNNFVECIDIFREFCYDYWFSFSKVKLITALVFLNMAPLHPGDVGKVCFCLGKEMLSECI